MSMLRSVLTYMGLGPDEEYDDGYLYEADRRSSSSRPGRLDETDDDTTIDLRDGADPHAQRQRPDWMGPSDGDPIDGFDGPVETELDGDLGHYPSDLDAASDPAGEAEHTSPRGRHDADRPAADARPLRAVPSTPDVMAVDDGVRVRSVSNHEQDRRTSSRPKQVRASILAPRSFGDAKILADEFKSSVPLVMNLQEVDRELARRLIDFASGICYALDGGMEKLASQVFLLVPDSVEVSDEERRRLEQLGFG